LQFLLKKDVPFKFNDKCKDAFNQLKKELTSPPVLCMYNLAAKMELHTDASIHGFGAILMQKQMSGLWGPIAYFSKATSDAEINYHSFELEMLAIVKAVERFHMYLQGIAFKIYTNCNSVILAMKKININPRIARWSMVLQNYQYKLKHRSSVKMAHVDCLCRCVTLIVNISIEDEVMYRQLMDPKLKKIATDLEMHENKHFSLINGLLFQNFHNKQLFVVLENMTNSCL